MSVDLCTSYVLFAVLFLSEEVAGFSTVGWVTHYFASYSVRATPFSTAPVFPSVATGSIPFGSTKSSGSSKLGITRMVLFELRTVHLTPKWTFLVGSFAFSSFSGGVTSPPAYFVAGWGYSALLKWIGTVSSGNFGSNFSCFAYMTHQVLYGVSSLLLVVCFALPFFRVSLGLSLTGFNVSHPFPRSFGPL